MGSILSGTEWLILILLVAFIIVINVSLFQRLKSKPGKDNWASRVTDAAKTLKDPFHDENQKMQELASRVNQLQTKTGTRNQDTPSSLESGDKNEQ